MEDPYLVVAVDDNPDVLELITASLEQTPYRVVGVQDPAQAVAVIQELKPNAITLDIMMPQINGWQILHQLKSNPATSTIPVILLTVLEDRSAGYVLGADEYLVKPVARDALLRVLHQLTNRSDAPRELPTDEINKNQQGSAIHDALRPIMLVHDERDIHKLIEKIVHNRDLELLNTKNGQDMMAIIEKAHPEMLMLFVKVGKNNESGEHRNIAINANVPNTPHPLLEGKVTESTLRDDSESESRG
ncbi:response regulator [Ktedonospora formicarum]|uniref:Response regulatory domain-containing protein n=1 Tax=Ktedonospora formicarum TaxID=2778364 RepID=A0A8J3I6L9_9CHLR|nr:response regulator [Ktedonospora formicarum]GHO46354.1 hypothetical protein KSX_45170 [Ktedonospora formicarum]